MFLCVLKTSIVWASLVLAHAPVIDLGYARHRAIVNTTGNYYNFTNIRFAAPPVGNFRFAAPIPPTTINRTITDGQRVTRCYQAASASDIAVHNGKPYNGSAAEVIPPAEGETEDCLFLDIVVPAGVYDAHHKIMGNRGKAAPVLVWIYGGGAYAGFKDDFNAAGLVAQSKVSNDQGLIVVTLNYRLGIFGFLSGPTFQIDGTANAGLLDQRLALEWVQKNIRRFGGDPHRVTIMGESAGGGSVLHQITAYGGLKGPVPFQRAIPQSGAYNQIISAYSQETAFLAVLSTASALSGTNVTTLAALRKLPTSVLVTTNALVIAAGSGVYPPVVDGSFVPALPSHLLLHGLYDTSISVMTGFNREEGFDFVPALPNVTGIDDLVINTILPYAPPSIKKYILETLYPPIFDGSFGYVDQSGRFILADSENYFNCNARYMARAPFKGGTYAYYVTIPPGYHGVDVRYTFFNGDTTTPNRGISVNATTATRFQQYLTNYAMNGNPNGKGLPAWPSYGEAAKTMTIGWTDFGHVTTDPAATPRCDWWQKSLWY